jgi:predicted GNAT family acetyltransferase
MSTTVALNEAEERYEISVDGALAGFTEAHRRGDVVLFPHTEIFADFEGHGLSGKLVRGALDDVRTRGLKVRATCSVVVAFLDKHAEYQDLIAV